MSSRNWPKPMCPYKGQNEDEGKGEEENRPLCSCPNCKYPRRALVFAVVAKDRDHVQPALTAATTPRRMPPGHLSLGLNPSNRGSRMSSRRRAPWPRSFRMCAKNCRRRHVHRGRKEMEKDSLIREAILGSSDAVNCGPEKGASSKSKRSAPGASEE